VNDVPKNRTVTYAHFVCDYRPQKTEPERTRLTVGGNLIDYPGDVATSTADITMAKLVWNSVILTDNAHGHQKFLLEHAYGPSGIYANSLATHSQ
jgi:hypothetical protein